MSVGMGSEMDRLRAIFAELGLKDVSTFIASGNVLFTTESGEMTAGSRERIESQLASQLGYEVPTFLRSPAELAAIVAFSPPGTSMQTASDSSHYVIFLNASIPDSLRSELTQLNSEMDQFHFSETEAHWLIQGKLTESLLFGPGLDQAMRGVRTTMRNMNTLGRIAAKIDRPETT